MRRQCEVTLTAKGPAVAEKKPWTHILIPFDAAEAFGSRGLIPVKGTLHGFAFRSSLMPIGDGTHYLNANKQMMAGAGVQPGDTVRLILERDTEERKVAIPEELAAALQERLGASDAFAALSYSHRKEYAGWVAGAKKLETRQTRARKAAAMVAEGKRIG